MVIKTVLNLLIFFTRTKKHQKASKSTKSTEKHQTHKKSTKAQPSKSTKTQINKRKIKNALKKHLSGKK